MSATDATLSVVCAQCASINRIPFSKRLDKPICGKCQSSLLPAHPVSLSDASFAKFVSRCDVPIVVDFWAAWCSPCRAMAPAFEEAAIELSPDMILAKLDTDASPQTASRFAISGIPTLILFHRGNEITRQSGVMGTQQIKQWASSSIK